MGSARIGVILNPHAAGGRALKTLPRVTGTLVELGADFSLYATTGSRDAWAQATKFANQGMERVIAVGGDGTFNEVANGLLDAGEETILGIVPAGTGCDLPRSLGLSSKSVEDAVRTACQGTPKRIDAGHARCDSGEQRYFLNVAGLGFDAMVAERAAKTKLPGGKIAYLAALATSLAHYHSIPVSVTGDSREIDTRAVFVTVANAKYFAGGFKITPMAEIDDGHLDLAIIGDLSLPDFMWTIPKVIRGKHTNHPKFTHLPVTQVRVEASERALVQVDGELLGEAPVEFTVRPGAITVSV